MTQTNGRLSRYFALAATILAAGCEGPAVDPARVAAERGRLLMNEEPDDAQTVLEVRHAMLGEEGTPKALVPEREAILVGSIGGTPNPAEQTQRDFPFVAGRASFFLADPEFVAELEEHGHHHAPGEECTFCAAHAADSAHALAAVQFKDAAGHVTPIDARTLFDLKEKDIVVVRGTVRIAAGGAMTVDATGIYVRR